MQELAAHKETADKAERINDVQDECKEKLTAAKLEHWQEIRRKEMAALLESKWRIGELLLAGLNSWEREQDLRRWLGHRNDYFRLARLTGMKAEHLRLCAAFYMKYPNKDYDLRPWREHLLEISLPGEVEHGKYRSRLRKYVEMLQMIGRPQGARKRNLIRGHIVTCSKGLIESLSELKRLGLIREAREIRIKNKRQGDMYDCVTYKITEKGEDFLVAFRKAAQALETFGFTL